MNYTRGKLIVSPAYGEKGELCYYNVKLGSQSIANFHDNQYINVDMCQAKANAVLYSKSSEMFEMMKTYIIDLKNIVSESDARNNRIDQIESLLKEIEDD